LPRKPDVDSDALKALLIRIFGSSVTIDFERTPEGTSCQTYRLTRGNDRYYLRVAEERHEDLSVDADILRRLHQAGAHVPDVVHVERFDEGLQRSVLIMIEIAGVSLAKITSAEVAARVVRDAAADAASINAIEVDGFGWLDRRRPGWPPRGQLASYGAFVESGLPEAGIRRVRLGQLLSPDHLDRIEAIISAEQVRPVSIARLAHGDLDATHIYCDGASYTGIIDFGELRGAEPEFDLGHFLLDDCDENPTPLFEHFLAGYRDAASKTLNVRLNLDDDQIRRSAILHGFRQLCGWLQPERGLESRRSLVRPRAERLADLLDGV